MSAGSLPKCCGFIASSASVNSPSVVKIGRRLHEKCLYIQVVVLADWISLAAVNTHVADVLDHFAVCRDTISMTSRSKIKQLLS